MRVLALDTCLGAVSVALGRQSPEGMRAVAELYEELQSGHAERLMPMIAELLEGAGMTVMELQRVAVTLGPGSFTGVRTGVSAARAFRLAAGVEVVGVTSLALLAHRAFDMVGAAAAGRQLLVAVDARRDRLYVQLFGNGALDPIGGPRDVTADEALALLAEGGALVAGSGAGVVAAAAGSRACVEVVAASLEARASDLVDLAASLAPLEHVAPIYIRPPDAKPQTANRLTRMP